MKHGRERVFVGLSGGVDSAVSAALLQQQGYEVVGAFIKIWQPEFIECTWREDRLDAMRVAAALGIEFREIDLSDAYKHEVVERMVREYEAGITPNPDVLCNEKIKFGAFAHWAFAQGADHIATGHYAQTRQSGNETHLVRGLDEKKDQSYFLYRISQSELARTIFPVGSMRKHAVRALAQKFDVPVAKKHDSQGLCFVGEVSMRDFLSRYIRVEAGRVVDTEGRAIGTHEGAALYTIGARQGLVIEGRYAAQGPWYIVHIDVQSNTITASCVREDATTKKVRMRDLHWIGEVPALPLEIQAQVRYHDILTQVNLEEGNSLRFKEPMIAPPGQSVVFYENDVCVGGGIIV